LRNVEVRCGDLLTDELPLDASRAAFVGNPPYVRHHRLSTELKSWGASASERLGVPFSKLAGLHLYFFLATALRARSGDVGCYITSAEWLDVRYGKGLRELLIGRLGLSSISVLKETEAAFEDAMTTAAMVCFEVGRRPGSVRFSVVPKFEGAEGPDRARRLPTTKLEGRWGCFARATNAPRPADGWVRLGGLASVHRGIATGANGFFVMDRAQARERGLEPWARPVITQGKQILDSDGPIVGAGCKVIVLLPKDVDSLPPKLRACVRRYLARGMAEGVPGRYLCRKRSPWWWLGKVEAPPIVASYMARRPPAFAANPEGILILNIAHGIYPRHPMSKKQAAAFVEMLNRSAHTFVGNGRRYQGGLEKFEPREMEDLLVPPSCSAGR
jgi:hypothetical protein